MDHVHYPRIHRIGGYGDVGNGWNHWLNYFCRLIFILTFQFLFLRLFNYKVLSSLFPHTHPSPPFLFLHSVYFSSGEQPVQDALVNMSELIETKKLRLPQSPFTAQKVKKSVFSCKVCVRVSRGVTLQWGLFHHQWIACKRCLFQTDLKNVSNTEVNILHPLSAVLASRTHGSTSQFYAPYTSFCRLWV